ncbi:(11Z)-hexadec-11-enoyl-CoA conjugase-like [Diabrotica virgifera virgifera]|uniref:Fatty acid desaturase domain-containing protein n=2 Tax=Diabrotica virgifera virgifera TaxID=50390 RepID=A0ABM5KF21_DIAVI|nr:(11Z)-hexadec-11-enoyl-CoA conjugase-like [Diabrotica virgifera virgifera]XP_050508793.1 (11Z)-hexadec-11-enoyl-CoA conjugase-like [Diabrotica virgifera virgifera]
MAPLPDDSVQTTPLPRQFLREHPKAIYSDGKGRVKQDLVWLNIFKVIFYHTLAVYGIWKIVTLQSMWQTLLFNTIFYFFALIGVTGGAHRLWSHRAYKVTLPMKLLMMFICTAAYQDSIHNWARDHRLHHKYTDTDADPHNSRRGFFFCHIGWLMVKKHPDVISKGKTIDLSDIKGDRLIMLQNKYFFKIAPILGLVLPTLIPYYFWGETLSVSFLVTVVRLLLSLHATFSINSFAHLYGTKPYDRTINPTESNVLKAIAVGEGWHNYHHTFPWDYRAAEFQNHFLNLTTTFLDFWALFGQVYDQKTTSEDMIRKRAARTGDGTWKDVKGKEILNSPNEMTSQNFYEECVWGWGDKDMKEEDKEDISKSH